MKTLQLYQVKEFFLKSTPISILSYDTQVGLVRNAWSDLFILGIAQCAKAMNLQSILTAIVSHLQTSVSQEKLTASRVKQVTSTICKVQEYVRAMNKMKIQDEEFAFLKAIALFGTGTYCRHSFLPRWFAIPTN